MHCMVQHIYFLCIALGRFTHAYQICKTAKPTANHPVLKYAVAYTCPKLQICKFMKSGDLW